MNLEEFIIRTTHFGHGQYLTTPVIDVPTKDLRYMIKLAKSGSKTTQGELNMFERAMLLAVYELRCRKKEKSK